MNLGYAVAGEGPTVVAVHGGLLSGRLTFGPVLADWAQRLRVLVPDRRGCERTPGVHGTAAEQARDLETFIDARANGRAHVVGISYGGVVALTALQLSRQVFLTIMDPRAGGRLAALVSAGDTGVHVVRDELRVWHTPLAPPGVAGTGVPTLVVSGGRSSAVMHRVGDLIAQAVGGRHHLQPAAGHAAHMIGRPFRDVLCGHIADAEAARSGSDPVLLAPWDPAWRRRYVGEREAYTAAKTTFVTSVLSHADRSLPSGAGSSPPP